MVPPRKVDCSNSFFLLIIVLFKHVIIVIQTKSYMIFYAVLRCNEGRGLLLFLAHRSSFFQLIQVLLFLQSSPKEIGIAEIKTANLPGLYWCIIPQDHGVLPDQSSIVFLLEISRLSHWDVTPLYMQLKSLRV